MLRTQVRNSFIWLDIENVIHGKPDEYSNKKSPKQKTTKKQQKNRPAPRSTALQRRLCSSSAPTGAVIAKLRNRCWQQPSPIIRTCSTSRSKPAWAGRWVVRSCFFCGCLCFFFVGVG